MSVGSILEVRDLHVSFSGVKAVAGASFSARTGAITALIGPNGAGKTTTFNLVAGALRPQKGSVLFAGEDVTGLRPDTLARRGLTRTFQLSRGLNNLTVIENLALYVPNQPGERMLNALARPPQVARYEKLVIDRAWQMAQELNLSRVANNLASDLSGGQKKLLEIGRALLAEPKLLLLDEPMAGVTPALAGEIASLLFAIRDRGITILVVEHNMGFVRRVSDIVIVLAAGQVIAEGSFDNIRSNEEVQLAYLGRRR